MPHFIDIDMPPWVRRWGRSALITSYVALAVAGAIGLTWPSGQDLGGWAFVTTRVSGGLILGASLVAAVAEVKHWWLVEMEAIAPLGAGLTAYIAVLLAYVGPDRPWLLMTAFIAAVLASLAGRSAVLRGKVNRRIRGRRAAEGEGERE